MWFVTDILLTLQTVIEKLEESSMDFEDDFFFEEDKMLVLDDHGF